MQDYPLEVFQVKTKFNISNSSQIKWVLKQKRRKKDKLYKMSAPALQLLV